MNNRKKDPLQFTVISLQPIHRGGWAFNVSANDYEEGILVVASHYEFCYTTLKYFQNHSEARRWIESLVSLDEKLIASELLKLKSENLKNK